jgi:hypothetical protein
VKQVVLTHSKLIRLIDYFSSIDFRECLLLDALSGELQISPVAQQTNSILQKAYTTACLRNSTPLLRCDNLLSISEVQHQVANLYLLVINPNALL